MLAIFHCESKNEFANHYNLLFTFYTHVYRLRVVGHAKRLPSHHKINIRLVATKATKPGDLKLEHLFFCSLSKESEKTSSALGHRAFFPPDLDSQLLIKSLCQNQANMPQPTGYGADDRKTNQIERGAPMGFQALSVIAGRFYSHFPHF